MGHEKVYAFCENLCKEETMTKEQIKDYAQKKVLSGTDNPSSELGEDGDIYLQYEE